MTALNSPSIQAAKSPQILGDVEREKIHATAQKLTTHYFAQLLQELSKDQEAIGGFGEELMRPELNRALAEAIVQSPAGDEITSTIEHRMIMIQEGASGHKISTPETAIDTYEYIRDEYLQEEAKNNAV